MASKSWQEHQRTACQEPTISLQQPDSRDLSCCACSLTYCRAVALHSIQAVVLQHCSKFLEYYSCLHLGFAQLRKHVDLQAPPASWRNHQFEEARKLLPGFSGEANLQQLAVFLCYCARCEPRSALGKQPEGWITGRK
jgi:hypothetical protein